MAETVISMQQASPSGSEGALYSCPALTKFVGSSLYVCNQNNAPVTITARMAVGGAGADPKQYLFYTLPLGAYSSMVLTSGLTMAAADVLYVDASTTNVAFQLSGVEIT